MAVLSESSKLSYFGGPGGLKVFSCIATLVSGACVIPCGFNLIVGGWATPIHASAAVAIQNITITGLTIPTNGFAKVTNGQVEIKSNEGASTIQCMVTIIGM